MIPQAIVSRSVSRAISAERTVDERASIPCLRHHGYASASQIVSSPASSMTRAVASISSSGSMVSCMTPMRSGGAMRGISAGLGVPRPRRARCVRREPVGRWGGVFASCETSCRAQRRRRTETKGARMEVASARAQLVDSTGGGATVLTTLPRSEVEEALRIEGNPPDLVIDVTRYAGEGETQTSSTGTVSISWAREDLEEILRRSEGDVVTFGFDGEALLRTFDEDVEAHGLREVAALLAVTVAAGSAAGVAMAQPSEGTGATATPTAAQADYGMPRAMPGDYPAA